MSIRQKLTAIAVLSAIAVFTSAPGKADSASVDAGLIEKGRSLVTAGNCVSCHTQPGGAALAGGVAFHTPFGTLYSTNITPDADTGIGQWTREEFQRAMREGVRPNGEHLYPAFPYTAFTKLSDADVNAIFVYLKTIPAARSVPPANDLGFPFNQRALISVWKWLFFENQRFAPNPSRSGELNRGAYLVEALGHCGACHTQRNFLGAERGNLALSGGTYLDKVRGGAVRPWFAVNLTPAPDGLGAWSQNDIVSYLKTGLNAYATSFGPMNDVIMNSTRHLPDSDLRAMAVYLKDLPAQERTTGSSRPSAEISGAGEALYAVHCATCHLPTGRGAVETGPSLAGNPVVQAVDPASLVNVILFGPDLPQLPLVQRTAMEPYVDKLSDEEVATLASFIRSAWGNRAGSVSADEVAQQR